jgi:hypothetical protein
MKTYFIVLLVAPLTISQWEFGASYKIKNEIPENGIGIHISRNLPFQRVAFGIKLRGEVNLFRQTDTENILGNNVDKNYLSEDYQLEAIGRFFFKNFSPYFGFGFGYGQIGINQLSSKSLLLILLAGLSFPLSFINPFIEIQGVNYFSDFDSSLKEKDISSFQFRGVIGVSFSLDTLRD